MLEGWLWSHFEGGLSDDEEREIIDAAVTFFEATKSDLSQWFTLTRHIDVDDVPLSAAFMLAAGGLPVEDIPRFARLGVRDVAIVRRAIEDDMPDDYLAALVG